MQPMFNRQFVRLAVPQKKVASRLPPPRASSARGGSLPVAAEKPPKEKPASPSRMKIPHEKEPHGDRPPDKARAAWDAATLPASRSHLVQGKRSLPAPNKLRGPGSARRGSFLISQTKPPPTPTSQFKIPAFPPGDSTTPRFSGAQRLQSCTSAGRVAHSTPARRPSGPARTPASTTRASGLPTPAGRRLSGLPLVTPSTVPRTLASPLCVSTRQLSSEPRRTSAGRAAPGNRGSQAVAPGADVSSDGSLSPAVPQALSFSPEKNEAAVSESAAAEPQHQAAPGNRGSQAVAPGADVSSDGSLSPAVPQALSFSPEKNEAAVSESAAADCIPVTGGSASGASIPVPLQAVLVDVPLGQRVTPGTGRPLGEPPLIDLSLTPEAPVASGPGSRPLLDLLTNTPDTDRKATAKPLPGVGQLIDLCSPLIQLSPEANKENVDSPLLRF
ncbi:PREDICTED: G2 and S phase-expressed protein 1 [Myotis davidii]|uniref:G2 and S phase-expressed protein 1 n=1 Tax=Myotis davidii TaxID=225400 RepID=UPI000767216F|nr:PREDICTED: G2 and S phase-expressed protein 1 [Myotis davidii]